MSKSVPRSTSLPTSQEKRRYPRLERKIPVKISSDHGDILTETINLSCFGVFCRVVQRLEPMTKLKVHLLLPFAKSGKVKPKSITCRGIVVRVQAAQEKNYYNTAIFFNDIAPKDSRTINEFVESMTEIKDHGEFN